MLIERLCSNLLIYVSITFIASKCHLKHDYGFSWLLMNLLIRTEQYNTCMRAVNTHPYTGMCYAPCKWCVLASFPGLGTRLGMYICSSNSIMYAIHERGNVSSVSVHFSGSKCTLTLMLLKYLHL